MAVTTHQPDPRHRPHNAHDPRLPVDHEAIRQHRVDVVRRLLERGLSSRSIAAILPGWDREIAAAIADLGGIDTDRR